MFCLHGGKHEFFLITFNMFFQTGTFWSNYSGRNNNHNNSNVHRMNDDSDVDADEESVGKRCLLICFDKELTSV